MCWQGCPQFFPLLPFLKARDDLGRGAARALCLGFCLLGCFTLSSLPLVSLFFSLNWKITFDQLQRAIRYWNIGILPRRRPLRSWYAFSGARQDSRKCTQAPGAEIQATDGGAQAGKERNKVTKKLLCAECWSWAYGFGLVCSVCLAVSTIPLLQSRLMNVAEGEWSALMAALTTTPLLLGVLGTRMVGWPTWLESGLSSPPLLTRTPLTVAAPWPGEEEGPATTGDSLPACLHRCPDLLDTALLLMYKHSPSSISGHLPPQSSWGYASVCSPGGPLTNPLIPSVCLSPNSTLPVAAARPSPASGAKPAPSALAVLQHSWLSHGISYLHHRAPISSADKGGSVEKGLWSDDAGNVGECSLQAREFSYSFIFWSAP